MQHKSGSSSILLTVMLACSVQCCNSSSNGSATGLTTGGAGTTGSVGPSNFSFFVTSQARLFALAQAFNGSTKGFGGDLRYGETGAGAGLRGADKICAAIAEASMAGNGRTWRAFLSASTDGTRQVNAIDRIGPGPWYDRIGRLVANTTSDLLNVRPTSANAAIINDLPNEDGVPNHDAQLSGNTTNQDNHDILTGSSASGTLYNASATCSDWTSSAGIPNQKPRCGHSWPAAMGGGAVVGVDGGTSPLSMDGGMAWPPVTDGGMAWPPVTDGGMAWPPATDGGMAWPPATDGGMVGGSWPPVTDSGIVDGSMSDWKSALDEAGCAPGYNLAESVNGQASAPGSDGTLSVGSGGGYGGLYCFALAP